MDVDGKAVCEDFKARFEQSGFITQHNFMQLGAGKVDDEREHGKSDAG